MMFFRMRATTTTVEDLIPKVEADTYLSRWRLLNSLEYISHLCGCAASRRSGVGLSSSSGASLSPSLVVDCCKEWLDEWAWSRKRVVGGWSSTHVALCFLVMGCIVRERPTYGERGS